MKPKDKEFFVEIVRFASKFGKEEVVMRMGPSSERRAKKVCSGVEINLNHQEYFTRIVAYV